MSKTQIMIVEDESIVAEDIKTSLEKMGYNVPVVVSSGEDAINKAEETRPDLVLMDIVLRGKINGIEAAGVIHSRLNVPVIYLTAYTDDNIIKRAKVTEPFGYITKPFENRELKSNIEMALYKHKIELKLRESREWLSTILGSIIDAVVATDNSGHIILSNPIAEKLSGRKQDEIEGKVFDNVFNIIHEETGERIKSPITEALEKGIVSTFINHLLVRDDGTKIPIDANSSPIKDQNDITKGAVIIFRDISNHKNMELDLSEKINDLQKFYEMAIGRELKMKDLKEQIQKLNSKLDNLSKTRQA